MRRAIAIVRVGKVGRRTADRFVSPEEQRDRIAQLCEREGLKLTGTLDELDVSGGAPLAKRPGLSAAIEAIEQGRAEVIVTGYFDRLVRNIRVQAEVVERVEAAGGGVLTADFGAVTNGTAAQWLSGAMLGVVSDYIRRSNAERTASAQTTAIGNGHFPVALIPGLRRTASGTIELDPKRASVVVEAFRLRQRGATVKQVRAFLAERGIKRSYHGTTTLLASRQTIGELHFGEHNLTVPAIIDRDTFRGVQKGSIPRGPRPKSERLLSRLGVLQCHCGARMVIGRQTKKGVKYPMYRCPPTGNCTNRVAISADLVENLVIDHLKELLRGIVGTASSDDGVQAARARLERAQANYTAAMDALEDFTDEQAVAKLRRLRDERDEAHAALDQTVESAGAFRLAVSVDDWDQLTLEEQRQLVRAVIERVTVRRGGRGAERVTIENRV